MKVLSKEQLNIKEWWNKIPIVYEAIWACIINVIIESLSRHSVEEGLRYMVNSPLTFLYNAFLIFITFSVVYLFRKRIFARILISFLWILLGIMNGYMLMKRVTPFNAQDIRMVTDAISMINSYFTPVEFALLIVVIIGVIIGVFAMWRRGKQHDKKIRRGLAVVVCVFWAMLFSVITNYAIEYKVITNYFGNIAFAYEDYGLPYCFMVSVFGTGISEPAEYSYEAMMDITNDGDMVTTVSAESEELPNIIIVQLESFFDPAEVEFLEMSTDPIPNFRNLADNYSSGYFQVPSVGAGTANTEFEVLTGMNMRSFGPGEYPYKTVLKDQVVESAATALADLGYGTYALHNNGGNFYSRALVYNNMGFDAYISKEFMNITEYTPQGWATDDILVENILESMDQTDGQDFVFAVSVEGHGSYPEEVVYENPTVTLTGMEDEGAENSWEYFLELVYGMDEFVGDLVAEVEERGEPTVIVFYGDHLPTLGLESSDVASDSLFNTNYVIWDNIGLEEQDQDLMSYQLTAELFSQLGIESGTIFNYHQENADNYGYLVDLETLQYDLLYGEQYAYEEEKIAEAGHMQMGIKNATVSYVLKRSETEYSLYGENFTASSQVYVNGVKQKKTYVNDGRIDLTSTEFGDNDVVTVSQVGSSDTIFRTSATYRFRNNRFYVIAPVNLGTSWVTTYKDV